MGSPTDVDRRISNLSSASLRKVIDPDVDLPGSMGAGQVVPDELLSIEGLGLDLTAEQRATLSREEIAAMLDGGFRFEAILMAGFCLELSVKDDLDDPRVTYALHEVGEETRHSRLFARIIEQLDPQAPNPLRPGGPVGRWLEKRSNYAIIRRPALFIALVLSGEEIPDLMQKLAAEHPDTDPFLAAASRYHRQEEARHLSFARMQVAERWESATWADRFAVRWVAPLLVREIFHSLVHPGVYETIGLPPWKTWLAVRKLPARRALLHRATRPILEALVNGGTLRAGRVPLAWRKLCQVDRHGSPLDAPAA